MDKKVLRSVLIPLYSVENIGIRVITSLLKKEGFQTYVIYLKRWKNNNIRPPDEKETEQLIGLIRNIRPGLIGISFGSPYLRIAERITDKIHTDLPGIPVVWGGIHPTIAPEDCINKTDILCIGEGEYPMLDLADVLNRGGVPDDIANLWIRKDKRIIKNGLRPLIQDLDSLPLPDLDDAGKYLIEDRRTTEGDPIKGAGEYRILSSRGCPYNCSYCYNSTLRRIYSGKGTYVRTRGFQSVLEELEYAVKHLRSIRKVKFDDDSFDLASDTLKDFCISYRKRIGIPFYIMLHPSMIDEERLLMLKRAGLEQVQIGIQTGSEKESKELYSRASYAPMIREFAIMNRRLKLDVVYDVILDNPMSTASDKEELLDFLINLPGPFRLFMYSLTVFPGTPLTETLLKRGIIGPDDIEGRADKSFRQFRLTMDYPRKKEDIFHISLLGLTSKGFIPRKLIRIISRSDLLRKHPGALSCFYQFCNIIKLAGIALKMAARGELTSTKIVEYGNMKKLINQ